MLGPRLILILLAVLTVVYWSVWKFIEAGQKERLAEQWRREQPPLPEHTHIQIGVKEAAPALHRKLILGVYVIPLTIVALAVVILNAI